MSHIFCSGEASRNEVNGSCGAVVNYDSARNRYSVVLSSNPRQILSLKVENLEKAGFVESTQAKWMLIKHQMNNSPEGAQIRNVWTKFSSAYLPSQLRSPETFFAVIVMIFAIFVYYFGVLKVLLFFSLFTLPMVLLLQEILNGSVPSIMAGIKMVPMKLSTAIREATGFNCSERLTTTLFIMFYIYSIKLLFSSSSVTRVKSNSIDGSTYMSNAQKYYKMGWDDAIHNLAYGSSMPSDIDERYFSDGNFETQPMRSGGFMSNFGGMISLMVVLKTLFTLSYGPTGPSARNVVPNLKQMEPWKIGMLAFSTYRMVRAFL